MKQRGKKVASDSPGLVDFAIVLVNSVLNLPDGQAKIFRRIKITKYTLYDFQMFTWTYKKMDT